MINLIFALIFTYYIGKGNISGISGEFLEKVDSIALSYCGRIFDSVNVQKMIEDILLFFEDNGYPFAKAKFVSFLKRGDTLDYNLIIDKGRLGLIEGVDFEGLEKVNKGELKKILRFKPKVFSKDMVYSFKNKLYFFPYLVYENYYFFEEKNKLFLGFVLRENLSNSFEGGVGYSNEVKNFFGNLKLHIDALLGSLRSIDLLWRRIKRGQQDFLISYEEPFFYFLDMKLKGNYSLFQRDTFYTRENFDILLYFLLYPFKLGMGGSYEENRDFILKRREYRILNIGEVEGGKRGYFQTGFYLLLNSKYSGKDYFKINSIFEGRKVFRFYGILGRFFYMNLFKKGEILNSEYFYIGGKENLRGYDEEEFKVRDAFIINWENYLTFSKIISPIVFFDSGILDRKKIRFSYGFGIMGERKNFSYSIIIAFPYKRDIYSGKLHLLFIQYF